jgi:hypothetical protein
MGQCGQGHAQSPLTRPKKVIGLDGVSIHQISAGTSHSVAWTSLPTDRLDLLYKKMVLNHLIFLLNIKNIFR